MQRCSDHAAAYARALGNAGADLLSGGDSPAGLLGPDLYRKLALPAETGLIASIKSATGNRGTFDPNDPNITHFAGGQSPIAGANALAGRYLRGLLNQKEEDLR